MPEEYVLPEPLRKALEKMSPALLQQILRDNERAEKRALIQEFMNSPYHNFEEFKRERERGSQVEDKQ